MTARGSTVLGRVRELAPLDAVLERAQSGPTGPWYARTVSYHLAAVYRKLGVSNRTALAARIARARAGAQAGPGYVLTSDSAARCR